MLLLLILISFCEILFIYIVNRDVLSPAFVFTFFLIVAELNVLSNAKSYIFELNSKTLYIVISGIFFLWLGTAFSDRHTNDEFQVLGFVEKKRMISLIQINKSLLFSLTIFNFLSAYIIFKSVVNVSYANGYSGDIFGALGYYRLISAMSNIKTIRLGALPTILTAITEAEGYVVAFIIALKLSQKSKLGIFLKLTFISSLIVTFCQGDRGGLFLILSFVFYYLLLSRENKIVKQKFVRWKLIISSIFAVIFLFEGSALLMGKNWNVSFYDYFSVYLGDPLVNLNTIIDQGIVRTPIWGYFTFGGILKFVYRNLGWLFPSYEYLQKYQVMNGHALGNVYTIFGYAVSDFGFAGSNVLMFFIGFVCQVFYNFAKKSRSIIPISKLLYGYILACLSFSFFSNKLCESISVFNVIVIIINLLFINLFTRGKNKSL